VRDVVACGGDQEFAVVADNLSEARKLFAAGKGELAADNSEVVALGEYDLNSIWEE